MTRTSSTAPEPSAVAGEPRFEAAAIYALVAGLRVRTYEDLLAPHWTMADRPLPGGRLDAARFVRSPGPAGAHVMVSLPALGRAGGWEAELSTAATRTVVIVPAPCGDTVDAGAIARQPAPAAEERGGRLARVRATMQLWRRSLHSWGARSLRSWRDRLAHARLSRRLRG